MSDTLTVAIAAPLAPELCDRIAAVDPRVTAIVPMVADLLRIQALFYIANPFIALGHALLVRRLNFKAQARIDLRLLVEIAVPGLLREFQLFHGRRQLALQQIGLGQRAMLLQAMPPAVVKEPAANRSPLAVTASARTVPLVPEPNADQVLPFQRQFQLFPIQKVVCQLHARVQT